jgi:4-hydroxy-4-methyl-2-oxoglutarate aldolase
VVTARCAPPDFGAVLGALDLVPPGGVLVIAAGGHRGHAMIGEILGGHLRRRGAAGLAVDGAVRDVAAFADWGDFPVFARSVTPRGPSGASGGAVGCPVAFGGASAEGGGAQGGVEIAPGDS